MTALVTGDPASVSSLGADLARQAERVRTQHQRLSVRRARVRVGLRATGTVTGTATGTATGTLDVQLRVLDACADALADAGRALQGYAVDLQLARSLAAEAEEFCDRHGLSIDESCTVTPPPGAYRVEDAAAYAHHVPEGQRLVDRARAERDGAVRALDTHVAAPMAVLRGTGRAVEESLL